ncbi:hypothetical protein AAF712_009492 [Marasmius tenuissimus]|uniref:Uncharacterized protein n=1 Tax=Marasmius tenuissimus TaxID=585030 RepID=A0ABR2ZQQ0_9AGAR|nr:hypothetical protein PM082_024257 [Marasmius tenuissimus]
MSTPASKEISGLKKDKISEKYSAAVPSAARTKQRTRNFKTVYVPVSTAERLCRSRERRERYDGMKKRVAKLRRYIRDECSALGKKYKRKQRYFMDMVYQGGVRLTKPMNELNDFNAFKSVTAYERRKAGLPPMSIMEIQRVYRPVYDALDEKGMKDIREKYKRIKDEERCEKVKRPSLKEKTADAAASLSQVAGILQGMKTRVGTEAVVLVVKNRPEDFMLPKWIVTDKRLMEYLQILVRGWNPVFIGQKVEAFAVAGCDIARVCKNQKEHAELLKKSITRLVQDALDEACSGTNVAMQYERFDTSITARYGVVIEGWPSELPFQKAGAFHGDVNKLIQVNEAWKSGAARFRKLTAEEFSAWKTARAQGLEDGSIKPKERKKRSDAGTKKGSRKGKETTWDGDSDESDKEDPEEEEGGNDEAEQESPIPNKSTESKKKVSEKQKTGKGNKMSSSQAVNNVGNDQADGGSTGRATGSSKKVSSRHFTTPQITDSLAYFKKTNGQSSKKSKGKKAAPHATDVVIQTMTDVTDHDKASTTKPRPKPRRKAPSNQASAADAENNLSQAVEEAHDQHDIPITQAQVSTEQLRVSAEPQAQASLESDTWVSSATLALPNPHGATPPSTDADTSDVPSSLPANTTTFSSPAIDNSAIDPILRKTFSTPYVEVSLGQPDAPSDHSAPMVTPPSDINTSAVPDLPDNIANDHQKTTRGRKHSQPPEAEAEEAGRGKRQRVPRKLVHLGYSTHPASRGREGGSGDEGTSDYV